jgi:cytochrome c-type biogenesis protein
MIAAYFTSFFLGLLTPLTAVCVLPLYPGFLAFLANRFPGGASRKTLALIGLFITLGILVFMLALGLIFTTLLQISLTSVTQIVSPIAFGVLIVLGLLLIANVDFSRFIPAIRTPQAANPLLTAFMYGLFFGMVILPCNPAFIATFFTKTFATGAGTYFANILHVVAFGLGMGAPLIALSLLSASATKPVLSFLTRHKRAINFVSGVALVVVGVYYLVFVFKVLG